MIKRNHFFDNLAVTEPSDASALYMHNRSKNWDTFGNDGYQRYNNRSDGNGYRRSNYNYRQHNNNYNNNKNGYYYRY